jgi:ribosomal protein S18 acetylase RimI-like enzyme
VTSTAAVLERLEEFYDTMPRVSARAEVFGGLVLFVRDGTGWPFYARPRRDASAPPSAADVAAVRVRQRELGLPEAFEWVHDVTPDLLAVARSAGLSVLEAPLMVLDPAALPSPGGLTADAVRLLDASSPDFAADVALSRAVAAVGFGAPGTDPGAAGAAARDAALRPVEGDDLAEERQKAVDGRRLTALASTAALGAASSGIGMCHGGVVEIAGVATLPTARRHGLGAAVTTLLARASLDAGAELVFLSASSDDVARVYAKVGFRRVGTACIAEPAPVAAPTPA